MNKDEAKAFYKYVVDADNPERIADDIENKTKQMTKDKSDTASVDINDTEVIHIHKNGKKYGIFNNYDFEVSKQKFQSLLNLIVKLHINIMAKT